MAERNFWNDTFPLPGDAAMAVRNPNSIVAPRVIAPVSGEILLLADVIRDHLGTSVRSIHLNGSGKSSALGFLKHEFPDDPLVQFIDDLKWQDSLALKKTKLLVFTGNTYLKGDLELRLAPWTEDDAIEYLLLNHRDECNSVMARLSASGDKWIASGDPGIWTVILDRMARSEKIVSAKSAIAEFFRQSVSREFANQITDICFGALKGEAAIGPLKLMQPPLDPALMKCLETENVRWLLICPRVVERIAQGRAEWMFPTQWPPRLLTLVAEEIRETGVSFQRIETLANTKECPSSSTAASLMIRIDPDWKPTGSGPIRFTYGRLAGANWLGVSLNNAGFSHADIGQADLSGADLTICVATAANFRRSNLRGANLLKAHFQRACLSGSDLRDVNATQVIFAMAEMRECDLRNAKAERADFDGADLTEAVLDNAILKRASFIGALLAGASFRGANLSRSNFARVDLRKTNMDECDFESAKLCGSNMEDICPTGTRFPMADFRNALLTGSVLMETCLAGCNFRNAKLAEINWENCDLKEADFHQSTFHMGSTRCGLVDSPYPSHGTRTGFYTDEFGEQYFKRPEEIRKASLRGCDLRGAKVMNCDFYLVDLREVKCDQNQLQHFQKCGAILEG